MAKLALVKCKYCGESFSRETEEFEKIGNRYAHKKCYNDYISNLSKEEKDKEELFEYLKKLFGNYNYLVTNKLVEKYIKDYHFSYSGIQKTLQYFYEIKKNPIEKSNGSIGIVPYAYDEARAYFRALEEANRKNADKQITRNFNPLRVIHIPRPQVEKKKRKLFKFLDKGEEE